MIELLASLWAYLAGAGVIGLILGWALRGVFIPPAKTVSVTVPAVSQPAELSAEQKSKLEEAEKAASALKAAQERMGQMEGMINGLRRDTEIARTTIASLESELQTAKSAPIPEDGSADLPLVDDVDDDAQAKAVWKTRYLESRVRFLEGKLEAAAESAREAEPAPEPVVSTEALEQVEAERDAAQAQLNALKALTTSEEASANAAQVARLDWQNRYLKARLNVIEAGTAAPEVGSIAKPVDTTDKVADLKSEIAALKSKLSEASDGTGESEQELARLRWRNRYLEGRLNYLEAADLDAAADADDSIVADVVPMDTPETQSEDLDDDTDDDGISATSKVLAILERAEARSAPPVESASGEETRPESLDAPNGEADDLKRIGGIGPKIEGILNSLGIFHFSQIAVWSEGEAAWIDSYLRFQGRVLREQWVEQAKSLAVEA